MLTEKIEKKIQLENDKKEAAADFGAQIKEVNLEIFGLSSKHRLGYENTVIECELKRDFQAGLKFYYEVGSGNLIKTEPITDDDDLQTHMEDQY